MSVTCGQHDNHTDIYDGKMENCCQNARGNKTIRLLYYYITYISNIGLSHLRDMSQIHALIKATPTLAAISLHVVLFQAQTRVLGMSER